MSATLYDLRARIGVLAREARSLATDLLEMSAQACDRPAAAADLRGYSDTLFDHAAMLDSLAVELTGKPAP